MKEAWLTRSPILRGGHALHRSLSDLVGCARFDLRDKRGLSARQMKRQRAGFAGGYRFRRGIAGVLHLDVFVLVQAAVRVLQGHRKVKYPVGVPFRVGYDQLAHIQLAQAGIGECAVESPFGISGIQPVRMPDRGADLVRLQHRRKSVGIGFHLGHCDADALGNAVERRRLIVLQLQLVQVCHHNGKLCFPFRNFCIECLCHFIECCFIADMRQSVLIGDRIDFRHMSLKPFDFLFRFKHAFDVIFHIMGHFGY